MRSRIALRTTCKENEAEDKTVIYANIEAQSQSRYVVQPDGGARKFWVG
jgi:hypothetical protein